MKLFTVKLLSVFLFLACMLLVQNMLTAVLPLLGGLVLLAVCGIATLKLMRYSLRKPARRKRAPHKPQPTLRVTSRRHSPVPGGPKAA